MKENYVNLCNKILYYFIAPILLLYFFLIDLSLINGSLTMLIIFGTAIVISVFVPQIHKKKNPTYKFNINSKYANLMAILVILELTYNISK